MTIDEYFKNYNRKLAKIKDKNIELIKLKDDWYNITGISYDQLKIKGVKTDIANQLDTIVKKENKLKKLIIEKDEIRENCEKDIERIENTQYITIIKLFYLDKCSIKKISSCMKMSESHIANSKTKAVKEFLNIINNSIN